MGRKVPLKSNKITWSADFYESSKGRNIGFKLCETSKRKMNPVPKKWVKKSIAIGSSSRIKNVRMARAFAALKMQGTGERELTRTTEMQTTGSGSHTLKLKFALTG